MKRKKLSKAARLLRIERKQRDMTLAQVAAELSVAESAVSQWENGIRKPFGPARILISERFGVPVDSWNKAA